MANFLHLPYGLLLKLCISYRQHLIYNENLLWERLCDTSLPRRDVEDLYDDLIDRLKAWIELRMLWLNEHVAAL